MQPKNHNKTFLVGLLLGSAKKRSPGLVNFAGAVAYHFCLAFPAAFTQPGAHHLAEPCITSIRSSFFMQCIDVVDVFMSKISPPPSILPSRKEVMAEVWLKFPP